MSRQYKRTYELTIIPADGESRVIKDLKVDFGRFGEVANQQMDPGIVTAGSGHFSRRKSSFLGLGNQQ